MKYDKEHTEIKKRLAFLTQNRMMIYTDGHFSLLYLQSALLLEDLISRESNILEQPGPRLLHSSCPCCLSGHRDQIKTRKILNVI